MVAYINDRTIDLEVELDEFMAPFIMQVNYVPDLGPSYCGGKTNRFDTANLYSLGGAMKSIRQPGDYA